jgi:hypothetical protein
MDLLKLADAICRGDSPAARDAVLALYLAAWHSLWHLAGPFMLAACLFPLFAFVFRGPVRLRIMGVAIFSSYGREASRQRIFWRSVVTWSPMWVLTVYLTLSRPGFRSLDTLERALIAHPITVLAAYGAMIVWAISTVAHPDCGLPDRLVGTFLWPKTYILQETVPTPRLSRVEVTIWTRLARSRHLPAPVLRLLVAAHHWYWNSVYHKVVDWGFCAGETRERTLAVFASLVRDAYGALRLRDRVLARGLAVMGELPPGGYRELGRQLGLTETAAIREVEIMREHCRRTIEKGDPVDLVTDEDD